MAYLSLYRKYRSQTFEEVSGQDHVTRTLQNAVRSGRVAHAYLFCGPRGTGKTTTARLLAKALNCERGPTPEPCNECGACTQINEGRYLDMKEIDAASNRGIDEIRNLRDNVAYTPVHGRSKVYVIDEAHQITGDAFNAFLKTLEEPPPHVVFIMATTEAHKIPATIVSRCQRFEFRRASVDQLRERVAWVAAQEGATIEDAALDLIARDANGGWRDALSLLEQVLAFSEGAVTARDVYTVLGTVETDTLHALGQSLLAADAAAVFRTLEELVNEGKDPRQLLRDVTGHFRGLMLTAAGTPPPGEPEHGARLAEQARSFGHARLVRAIEVLAQTEREARWSEQPRLLLELALVRLLVADPGAERAVSSQQSAVSSQGSGVRGQGSVGGAPQAGSPPRIGPGAAERSTLRAPRSTPDGGSDPNAERRTPNAQRPTPPPLTLGDARAGDTGDDQDPLAAFGEPPPAADPSPAGELLFGDAEASLPPVPEQPTPNLEHPRPNAHGRTPNAQRPTPEAQGPTLNAESSTPPVSDVSATTPDTPGGALDIDLLRRKWKVVLEELYRARKVNVATFLVDTQPERFEQDVLVLRFPTTTMAEGFERRSKEFGEPVVQAIARVTGVQCRVRAEIGKPGAPSQPAPPRSRQVTPPSAASPGSASEEAAAPAPTLLEPSPPAPNGSGASQESRLPAPPPSAGNGDELIHNIIEVFDGRIVDEPETG